MCGLILRWIAILCPVFYFGAILLAAYFYPQFNFFKQVSSELGARSGPHPYIFNIGLMSFGVAIVIASISFRRMLWRLQAQAVAAWLVCGVLALFGMATLLEGIFPWPDWRHSAAASFGLPNLAGPALLAVSLRQRPEIRRLRIYLIITNILMIAMLAIYLVAAKLGYAGLGQLLYSLLALPWISVSTYALSGSEPI